MKRSSCPAAFVFLAFAMTFSLLSCGGGDDGGTTPQVPRYEVTDLQGTWYLNTVNTNNTGAAGDSYYGQMEVSSGGNIVKGSSSKYINYPISDVAYGELAFTGGLLHLTQDTGVPSGTINTDSFSFIIDSGKMDPSKFAMIFNSHKGAPATQFDLTVAFKGGGSYVSSDLIGTWQLFGLSSRPRGVGAVRGFLIIDNSLSITAGSFIVLDGGIPNAITSGFVSLLSNTQPVFSSAGFTTSDSVIRRIDNGIIDISKSFASFVSSSGTPVTESEIVVMIKEAGSFTTPDLSGTWYIAGAAAGHIDPADNGAITGNLTMNSAGTITGGTLNLPDASASITGGSMTVNALGALVGTITMGTRSIVFTNGRLDASKKKMAFTDINTTTAPDEEKRLFILFK